MKKVFSILLGFVFLQSSTVHATENSLTKQISTASQFSVEHGITYLDGGGQKISLNQWLQNAAFNRDLRGVLPASESLGLYQPLGFKIKGGIVTKRGVSAAISLYDGTFSQKLSSTALFYDFGKTANQNKTEIEHQIQKVISTQNVSKNVKEQTPVAWTSDFDGYKLIMAFAGLFFLTSAVAMGAMWPVVAESYALITANIALGGMGLAYLWCAFANCATGRSI